MFSVKRGKGIWGERKGSSRGRSSSSSPGDSRWKLLVCGVGRKKASKG